MQLPDHFKEKEVAHLEELRVLTEEASQKVRDATAEIHRLTRELKQIEFGSQRAWTDYENRRLYLISEGILDPPEKKEKPLEPTTV